MTQANEIQPWDDERIESTAYDLACEYLDRDSHIVALASKISAAMKRIRDDSIDAGREPYMSQYTHRNGESELPTVEGVYWFKGKLNHWLNGELDYAHDGLAGIETVMADYYHPGHEHWLIPGEEGDHLLTDAEGQWWGPIVPPWELDAREAAGEGGE